tara:strand:- start:256 stop:990 length:735 start_codon:yes stop_codon:yes gene_type:complete
MKNKELKIIAVVSARGGSKGIPGKNIKLLNGKPLINHCFKNLLKCKVINRVILSSDSKKILRIAKKSYPKIETMLRPKNLAQDKTPLTSVAKYVSSELKRKNYIPDFVLQVAPTCPFIKLQTIEKIISLLKKNKSDCVVTLKRIEHEHPYRAKELNVKNGIFKSFIKNTNVEKFISRQDLPVLYCTSGGIYARSYKLLQKFNEKNFCLGKNPIGVIVDDIESINIDRKIDFDFAELIAKKYRIK